MADPAWRIAAASVAGSSHRATGLPCQDAHACQAFAVDGREALVAIVSDGAGTAPRSDVGSARAVGHLDTLVSGHFCAGILPRHVDGRLARTWYACVTELLAKEASREGADPRDYACTLLGAYVDDEGGAFMQVGDGAAVIRMAGEDGWRPVIWPQHGRYANESNFVVGERVGEDLEFAYVPGRIAEVALFTDGLENLVLDRAARTAPRAFFDHVSGPVRRLPAPGVDPALSGHLADYLSSPDVSARTDDDVTLVIASRGPEAPRAAALPESGQGHGTDGDAAEGDAA